MTIVTIFNRPEGPRWIIASLPEKGGNTVTYLSNQLWSPRRREAVLFKSKEEAESRAVVLAADEHRVGKLAVVQYDAKITSGDFDFVIQNATVISNGAVLLTVLAISGDSIGVEGKAVYSIEDGKVQEFLKLLRAAGYEVGDGMFSFDTDDLRGLRFKAHATVNQNGDFTFRRPESLGPPEPPGRQKVRV